MPLTPLQDAALRARLAEVRDDPTLVTRAEQEAALDAAFDAVGHDPTWDEWHAYARRFLPTYRRADPPSPR